MEDKEKKEILNKVGMRDDPTRRRKCPNCGSKNYLISAPLEHCWEVKNGKKIWEKKGRYDVGSFRCNKCGFEEVI